LAEGLSALETQKKWGKSFPEKSLNSFVREKKLPFLCTPKNWNTSSIHIIMAKVCQLTGKKAQTGHKVSFSNKKSKRRFEVNLKLKRFYIPEEDRWVTLRVSTSAIKNINKKGISAVMKEAYINGLLK
jgi:large subunit ribosomal protein L28